MYVTRRRTRRSGFSLLELLIVLGLIGLLSAMVVPQLLGRQEEASVRTTQDSIRHLELALRHYGVRHDSEFPAGDEDVLKVLIAPTDANGQPLPPYIESIPCDAWGHPLCYQYPPTRQTQVDKPDIWSPGPNGVDENGNGDDVNNWDNQEDVVLGSIGPL